MIRDFDIYLTDFPYQDGSGSKIRPVIIIDKQAFSVDMITSSDIHTGTYYQIQDVDYAGLNKKSYINLSVQSKLSENDLIKYVGHLSNNDIKRFLSKQYNYEVESISVDDDIKELIEVLNIES